MDAVKRLKLIYYKLLSLNSRILKYFSYPNTDDVGLIFSTFIGHFVSLNSEEVCMAHCIDHSYFGLMGSGCFCSNNLPDENLLRPGECNSPCAGNTNQICGALTRISVYPVCKSWNIVLMNAFENSSHFNFTAIFLKHFYTIFLYSIFFTANLL